MILRDSKGRFTKGGSGGGFQLSGKQEMSQKLLKIAKRFPDEVARAMYQEAGIEATEVKRRTPWDTGNLKGTIRVLLPERSWRSITVRIAAGGASALYAIYVHEDLEANHPRGGQAKYIESVIMESKPYMGHRIAKRIDLNRMLLGGAA